MFIGLLYAIFGFADKEEEGESFQYYIYVMEKVRHLYACVFAS
jgi:hypothetical protein